MNNPHRDAALIDALQAAIPLAQLVISSTARQHDDAARILDSLVRAVEILRPPASPDRAKERHLPSLHAAIVRSGRTVAEVGFLVALSEERLGHLCSGAEPTPEEVARLKAALPDWLPKTGRAR